MLEVSLKRAADLERAALEAASKVRPLPVIPVSIHAKDRQEALKTASTRFGEAVEAQIDLVRAHYTIRAVKGAANAACGIDTVLTQLALLDATEKRLVALLDLIEAQDDEIMTPETATERLDALKERFVAGGDRLRSVETVRAMVASPEQVEALRDRLAVIRQERSDLNDRKAGLNLNTKVALDDATVDILRRAKIIA